jgi:hypothetical protein
MNSIRHLVSAFALQAEVPTPTFTNWDFKEVSSIEACPSASRYFSDSVPSSTIDLEILRILAPEHLLLENTELIPGCRVAPYGFITFAVTDCGDSVSIDLSTGSVYLVSTDKYEGEMIRVGWKPDYRSLYDPIPITRANIIATCESHWPDIETALVALVTEEEG